MSVFVRSIIGIVFMIGLFFVIGCSSTQSGSKTATSVVPWAKKEPEKAKKTSMGNVLRESRVSEQMVR
jgi:hypothetical protein